MLRRMQERPTAHSRLRGPAPRHSAAAAALRTARTCCLAVRASDGQTARAPVTSARRRSRISPAMCRSRTFVRLATQRSTPAPHTWRSGTALALPCCSPPAGTYLAAPERRAC
eukprot:352745-Chlamydomonas_euryale.AAC.6